MNNNNNDLGAGEVGFADGSGVDEGRQGAGVGVERRVGVDVPGDILYSCHIILYYIILYYIILY